MSPNPDCSFCLEASSELAHDWLLEALGAPPFDRMIWSGAGFFVVPSLGPLTDDHCLVVSRFHHPSLRDALPEERRAAIALARRLASSLSQRSDQPAIVFENGSGDPHRRASDCVNHLHVHVLTAAHDVLDRLFAILPPVDMGRPLDRIAEDAAPMEDYVLCEQIGRRRSFFAAAQVDRQLIRKAFARACDRPDEWDWRSRPNVRLVIEIADRLRGMELPEGPL